MKQLILGTPIGRAATAARDWLDILRAVRFSPEQLGTIANDQLAASLTAQLCRHNKCFVDVGAHIGSVLSAAHDHSDSIRLVAIEAMPDKAAKLRRKFSSAEVFECAAGETEGEAAFFVNKAQTGYSSLIRPQQAKTSQIEEISVKVKRLDDLLANHEVDVMKIDVEGAELGVLRGGEEIISKHRPVIMFESAPSTHGSQGFSKEDLWQWFSDHGYEIVVPNRLAHDGPGLTREGFVESHYYPRRTTNYFATPAEARIAVRDRARKILGTVGP
jgi:FkbM family methyltransferase